MAGDAIGTLDYSASRRKLGSCWKPITAEMKSISCRQAGLINSSVHIYDDFCYVGDFRRSAILFSAIMILGATLSFSPQCKIVYVIRKVIGGRTEQYATARIYRRSPHASRPNPMTLYERKSDLCDKRLPVPLLFHVL